MSFSKWSHHDLAYPRQAALTPRIHLHVATSVLRILYSVNPKPKKCHPNISLSRFSVSELSRRTRRFQSRISKFYERASTSRRDDTPLCSICNNEDIEDHESRENNTSQWNARNSGFDISGSTPQSFLRKTYCRLQNCAKFPKRRYHALTESDSSAGRRRRFHV